jgi:acetyl-CoA C-acetyltransferase
MTQEDMAQIVVKNRRHAALNKHAHLNKEVSVDDVMNSRMISWPIKLMDCCPQSSGGGAMVLASEKFIRDNKLDAVWITGVGHCSETYYLGDRMGTGYTADHADAYALSGACQRAYRMAGVTDAVTQIDVAELYSPFSNTEFHAIEAAGLAKVGTSVPQVNEGRFSIGGAIPVNPSGGTLCTNAIAVTAMIRVAEVALQVWGKAGGHQVKGAKRGVATGNGGDHQFFGAIVVEA